MAVDNEKLNALKAIAARGGKIACAEILSVQWSGELTVNYASRQYDDITPHRNVSLKPIEARLLNTAFHAFELNPDLRTETINFTFDNIDKDITGKFQTYGEGVRCELYYYFADVDLLTSVWFGQLTKPQNSDYAKLEVAATNGRFSREATLPSRFQESFCSFNFGGLLDTADQILTNGCPYDRQIGGSVGLLNSGVPFTSCPRRDEADCSTRLGDAKFFGGFNADVNAVVTDQGSGFAGKVQNTKLKTPVPVLFGAKFIRPILLYGRKELSSNVDASFYRAVFEIGEGTVESIFSIQMLEKYIEAEHIATRNGSRGQQQLPIWSNIRRFSGTAIFTAANGRADHRNTQANSVSAMVACHGFNQVAVFTDAETFARQWSNIRAWVILELYTNQKFGMRQAHANFDIDSFIETAEWLAEWVRFTHPNGDTDYDHVRDYCDVYLKGEPAANVIASLCEQGRISVPFQNDGKYMITPFRAFTDKEIEDAPVFTDKGENRNIFWESGQPSLRVNQKSDTEITNVIKLTFENSEDFDNPRQITCEDVQQQIKAGQAKGTTLERIPKDFSASSVRSLNQAIKLGFYYLWFGNAESTGIKNNLQVTFTTDMLDVLNLRRYQVIKIVSDELNGFEYDSYQFEYFTVQKMFKNADNSVTITAFAYNKTAIDAFESEPPEPNPNPAPLDPPEPSEFPVPCVPTFNSVDQFNGYAIIEINPC